MADTGIRLLQCTAENHGNLHNCKQVSKTLLRELTIHERTEFGSWFLAPVINCGAQQTAESIVGHHGFESAIAISNE